MQTYLDVLKDVMTHGEPRNDRTGIGTIGLFAKQMRFNLYNGFPLLTTKKMSWHIVRHELLWMLSGSTNVKPLQKAEVRIWDEWADENGDLGPIYGRAWRHWPTEWTGTNVDQIQNLVNGLRDNPDSRRHIVTAWNPAEIDDCALPPCHVMFQCYSVDSGFNEANTGRRRLSLHMYQRSCDLFLGVPYNIAFYGLLTHMLAAVTNHDPYELVITLGDAHIYNNHFSQVREQLTRAPLPLPFVDIPRWKGLESYSARDLILKNYVSHDAIKAEVAV